MKVFLLAAFAVLLSSCSKSSGSGQHATVELRDGTSVSGTVLSNSGSEIQIAGDDKLTRTDKLVLSAVNGTRTVNEVIKESAVGSFDAIKAVYQFLQSRVLRPRAA